jgi:hypothetical protein
MNEQFENEELIAEHFLIESNFCPTGGEEETGNPVDYAANDDCFKCHYFKSNVRLAESFLRQTFKHISMFRLITALIAPTVMWISCSLFPLCNHILQRVKPAHNFLI